MPLLTESWVVERCIYAFPYWSVGLSHHYIISSYPEYLTVKFNELHFRAVDEKFLCIQKVLGIVEVHIIPTMHAFPSGPSFIFFVIWENSLQ